MDRIETLRNYRPDKLPFGEDTGTSGSRRPYFDVGEYLPAKEKGEIEFARISLASSTGDVLSLRIKKEKKLYVVKIVDEYDTNFFEYKSEYEKIPTQGEVSDIICNMNNEPDSQYYWLAIIEQNGFETIDQITEFIQIDSNIYPDLNELFKYYLVDNNFNYDTNNLNNELSEKQVSALAEIINSNHAITDWDSLMGTLCFNIWHNTNYAFLQNNDINDMDISFLCALNVFQKWNTIYLSKIFDVTELSKDASPFVISEFDKLNTQLSNIEKVIIEIKINNKIESSKLFASIFTDGLYTAYNKYYSSVNPLDYFQKGVEILLLLAIELSKSSNVFSSTLLDIGEYELTVQKIIREINSLEEFEN